MNKVSNRIGLGLFLSTLIFAGALILNQRSTTETSVRFSEGYPSEMKRQSEEIYSFLYQITKQEQVEEQFNKLVLFLSEKKRKKLF